MARKSDQKRLGRGLSALLADVGANVGADAADKTSAAPASPDPVQTIAIDRLQANPNQPRRHFDADALAELTASIAHRGVLQPLIVRPLPDVPERFEIVAGERRWRAAQAVPLHDVPVIVRAFDDQQMLEVAIVENIQRADLSPLDEAEAYQQLIDRFGHTQQEVAEALGKSRSHLANMLRLLTLPVAVREAVQDGRLTAGHARALVGQPEAEALAEQIIRQSLTVRQAEALVRDRASARRLPKPAPATPAKDADTRAVEADLSANLSMPVTIAHRGDGGGELRVRYTSLDQLDALCQRLGR